MAKRLTIGLLRGVKVLEGIDDKPRRSVARAMETTTLLRGHALWRQGQSCSAMTLLVEGRLGLDALVNDEQVTVGKVYPGETLNSMSLIHPGPQEATVTAETMSTVSLLSNAAFVSLEQEWPVLAPTLQQATRLRGYANCLATSTSRSNVNRAPRGSRGCHTPRLRRS